MIGTVILEGLGLGALLVLVCAFGIRNGAVGMAVIAAVLAGVMALPVRRRARMYSTARVLLG